MAQETIWLVSSVLELSGVHLGEKGQQALKMQGLQRERMGTKIQIRKSLHRGDTEILILGDISEAGSFRGWRQDPEIKNLTTLEDGGGWRGGREGALEEVQGEQGKPGVRGEAHSRKEIRFCRENRDYEHQDLGGVLTKSLEPSGSQGIVGTVANYIGLMSLWKMKWNSVILVSLRINKLGIKENCLKEKMKFLLLCLLELARLVSIYRLRRRIWWKRRDKSRE